MQLTRFAAILIAIAAISCEYPYIFGTSINTKGIANGLGNTGIAGSQTTAYGLDDVSQSVSYANGTGESNARTNGQAIFTTQLTGANTTGDAVNTGNGNALSDSVSKSFNPYESYYNANYSQYITFLNELFQKYPEKREEIIKIVLKYSQISGNKSDSSKLIVGDALNNKMTATKNAQVDNSAKIDLQIKTNNTNSAKPIQGLPTTIANYNNPSFNAIGQTTFDYQRARGSGLQTAASTNSGSFRWNGATVHQGDATGNARQGWATSSSNDYGLGRVNYVNSEQNSGAYGNNAQTNSSSNYYLAKDAVWNNGDAWGRSEGKDSLAFSNLNGNSYGYGAVNGDTNAYTDGNLSVSKSQIKGAPYFPGN